MQLENLREMTAQRARLEAAGIEVESGEATDTGWHLQVIHEGADGILDVFRVRSVAHTDDALRQYCTGCPVTPQGPHFHPFPVRDVPLA